MASNRLRELDAMVKAKSCNSLIPGSADCNLYPINGAIHDKSKKKYLSTEIG